MKSSCPFCHREISVKVVQYEDNCWAVTCEECGATGPSAPDRESAIERWHSGSQTDGSGLMQMVSRFFGH